MVGVDQCHSDRKPYGFSRKVFSGGVIAHGCWPQARMKKLTARLSAEALLQADRF